MRSASLKQLFDETPVDLRRLVLLLYGLVLPPFLGVLHLAALPSNRARSLALVFAICTVAAAVVWMRRTPVPYDWIFPVGIAPTVSCGIAYAASGGGAVGFVSVLAAPLAWSAVLCGTPTVVAAWLTGSITCLLLARLGGAGWLASSGNAALYALIQGLVAWVVYGKTESHREARLRKVERRLNDIELLTKSDGVIVDINDRAAEAYGYPREELLGAALSRVEPDLAGAAFASYLERIEERGGGVFEVDHLRRDGSKFPVEVSARVYDLAGQRYLHSLVRDISARRAVETQRRFVETLFSHMQEAVVVLDEVFKVKIWSKGAERLFGFSEEEVLGRSPFEFLIPKESEAATARAITQAAAGEETTYLMRRLRKDGQAITCSVNIVAVQDGTGAINGVMGVGRDVTAQQEAEAALRESEERLRRALREAKAATTAREQILAVVAHDLRNPLSAVAAAARGLENVLREPDAERELREGAELIRSATARMSRLIEDLLDAAAIENGALRLVPDLHDGARILEDAARSVSAQAALAGVSLSHSVEAALPEVHCDRLRVLQVLLNLVSNAIHATPRGGKVSLSARAEEGGVRFTVKDTGRGLEKDQEKRLFLPYERGESAGYKGAGLGLAIARGIVVGHGGRIFVERPEEGGTAFHFVIPPGALSQG